jgi:hypothetical protein
MYGVMGNLYGRVAAEVQNSTYQTGPRPITAHVQGSRRPRTTKASELMSTFIRNKLPGAVETTAQQQFKLKKFTNTGKRTETHIRGNHPDKAEQNQAA